MLNSRFVQIIHNACEIASFNVFLLYFLSLLFFEWIKNDFKPSSSIFYSLCRFKDKKSKTLLFLSFSLFLCIFFILFSRCWMQTFSNIFLALRLSIFREHLSKSLDDGDCQSRRWMKEKITNERKIMLLFLSKFHKFYLYNILAMSSDDADGFGIVVD